MTRPLRIATRGSAQARTQAQSVADALTAAHPGLVVELVFVDTTGDQRQDVPLHTIGGQGVFVKEVQRAVLDGHADFAVHSAKDLPALTPELMEQIGQLLKEATAGTVELLAARAAFKRELRAHAARTQREVLDRLATAERDGSATNLASNWLGNFVAVHATRAVKPWRGAHHQGFRQLRKAGPGSWLRRHRGHGFRRLFDQ